MLVGVAAGYLLVAGDPAWFGAFVPESLAGGRDFSASREFLAGTWVIAAPKRQLGLELLAESEANPAYVFTAEQLDAYGVFELQTREKVLRAGNIDAMGTVAYTIRTRIGAHQHGGDAEFLGAYYDALRLRLERNLLFGRRREDKHTPSA